jgi:probable HAF family extracellular repeat protein
MLPYMGYEFTPGVMNRRAHWTRATWVAVVIANAMCVSAACLAAHAQTVQFFPMTAFGGTPSGLVIIGLPPEKSAPMRVMKWAGSGGTVTLPLPSGFTNSEMSRADGFSWMISDNGTVVVGTAYNSASAQAVRWNGMTPTLVPLLPGSTESSARGVSADGLFVYGTAYGPTGARGFRWAPGQLATDLGTLPGYPSTYPEWANASCSIIVGEAFDSETPASAAFRWVNGQMAMLPMPPGYDNAAAWCTSADGAVTVGSSYPGNGAGPKRGVRWRNGRVMLLPPLPGMTDSDADLVSDDGGTIVGVSDAFIDGQWVQYAFRWTEADGLQSLAPMTRVLTVSSNGAIVVGIDQNYEAYIWTPSTSGTVPLDNYLTSLGINVSGYTLYESGSSRDGTAIAGTLLLPNGNLSGYAILGLTLPGTGAPTAPLNIAATDGTSTSAVTVSWSPSPGATGYRVLRSYAGGSATQIASVGTVTTFVDTTAFPGVTYEYSVRAVKGTLLSTIGGADDGRRGGTLCVGDLNGDRAVNGDDLGLLLGSWGPNASGNLADINADGTVNGDDLDVLLGRWGACPP